MVPFPVAGERFPVCKTFRESLGPTHSPNRWVRGLFPPGKGGRCVKLITLLHLLKRLRIHGRMPIRLFISYVILFSTRTLRFCNIHVTEFSIFSRVENSQQETKHKNVRLLFYRRTLSSELLL